MELLWISFAFFGGLLLRPLGLPSLVGYLIAGFVVHALFNDNSYAYHNATHSLQHIAHLGVQLLLFAVGLKLNVGELLKPAVWGVGLLHFLVISLFFLLFTFNLSLAMALAFSSTVLAAKALEDKRELRAFHGRLAIGILVLQDLIALAMLSVGAGKWPTFFAAGLLILPFLRPLLNRLVNASGHDDLLLVGGLFLALGGAWLFEQCGLSAELGALTMGALLADHPRSKEIGYRLWSVKELFLVAFFLKIGLAGLPDPQTFLYALFLNLLLPIKALLFFALFLMFRLRARSAFLSSLSLASYSEFALIVGDILLPELTITLALTVALSFIIAAPLNRLSHRLYERYEAQFDVWELPWHHPDEEPVSLGQSQVLVMGMGPVGVAAYDYLKTHQLKPVGLDSDMKRVEKNREAGRRVLYGDAEDAGFWQRLRIGTIKGVVLAMDDCEAKLMAIRQLRMRDYRGFIAATTLYPEEGEKLRWFGADFTFDKLSHAGVGLAESVQTTLLTQMTPPSK